MLVAVQRQNPITCSKINIITKKLLTSLKKTWHDKRYLYIHRGNSYKQLKMHKMCLVSCPYLVFQAAIVYIWPPLYTSCHVAEIWGRVELSLAVHHLRELMSRLDCISQHYNLHDLSV
jgi:hypothetical protein